MPVFNNVLAGAAGSGGAADFKIERSLRFNIADSAYLHRQNSSSTTSSAKKFTLSFWVKRVDSASNRHVFFSAPSLNSWSNWTTLFFMGSGALQFEPHISQGRITTVAKYLDYSAWSHFVLSVDSTLGTAADRIKIFHNNVRQEVTGTDANQDQTFAYGLASSYQQIGFNSSSYGMNGLLADIHFVDDQALDPTEFGEYDEDTGVIWNPKQFSGTHGVNGWHLDFSNNSTKDTLGNDAAGSNNFTVNNIVSPPAGDFDLSTASLNPWGGASYVSGRDELYMAFDGSADSYLLLSNQNNHGIDFSPGISVSSSVEIWGLTSNQSVTTNLNSSSVQYTSGQWTTVYQGTGTLTSITMQSNNNRPALARIRVDGTELIARGLDTDSLLDSPSSYDDGTNIGGNYATWNAAHHETVNKSFTLSNGALKAVYTQSSTYPSGDRGFAFSTIGMSSGKWYFELTGGALYNDDHAVGIATALANGYFNPDDTLWTYRASGHKYVPAPNSGGYGDAWGEGDVIGVAFDADAGSLTMYKNGTSQGVLASGLDTTETYFFVWGGDGGGSSGYTWTVTANFGQQPWVYPPGGTGGPPATYKALCTQNLDNPLIVDGSTAMDVDLYSGTGSTHERSNFKFRPDLVWIKSRSTTYQNLWFDSVRGATKYLKSDATSAEQSNASTLSSFDDDGFTLGGDNEINKSSETYCAWAWDAGNYNNTFASSSYDQSQVWSNLATLSGGSFAAGKGLIHGFDGTTTTSTEGDSYNEYLELPISATISAGGVRVYAAVTSSNPLVINLYNGSSNVETVSGSNSGGQWYATSTYSGAITKIRIERTGRAFEFNAVEVNGKILTNAGLIAAGSLNSSTYTQGDVYSDDLSATYNNEEQKGFDGNLTTTAAAQANGGTITWTPSGGLSYTSSVRAYTTYTTYNNQAAGFRLNGGSLIETASAGWYTLATGSGTINTISHSYAATYRGGFNAIEVDGKILVDSNQTPANVPSISSVNRANQTAGFSITNYSGNSVSGSSVAHNLGKKPDLIIVKARNRADNWLVYHSAFGGSHHSDLNLTGGFYSGGSKWLKDATSGVFYMHTDPAINGNFNYVAYAWTAVEGYSAFGTYVGNGSATSGPFVYTGMRPKVIWQKATTSETYGSWHIYDTARDPINPVDNELYPNASIGEGHIPSGDLNILSNGFQMNTNYSGGWNTSGVTYIWAAWSENPFKIARAR